MALDAQLSTYRRKRPRSSTRTTYGLTNVWYSVRRHEQKQHQGLRRAATCLPPPEPEVDVSNLSLEKLRQELVQQHLERSKSKDQPDYSKMINPGAPVHAQYHTQTGYDDFHRAYMQLAKSKSGLSYPHFGPPRLRQGRGGGGWRNMKEVLQAKGQRIVFVDGIIRIDDNNQLRRVPFGSVLQPQADRVPAGIYFHLPMRERLAAKLPDHATERVRTAKFSGPHLNLTEKRATESGNWNVVR